MAGGEQYPMLAVLYARVSPGEHAKKGYSVDEQLRECRAKATALAAGQPVAVSEFTDVETSGDIDPLDRPGFAAALQTARAERAAYFLCLDPDRFSRDLYQALGAARTVDATGARLEFVVQEFSHTPEGQLFFHLRLAMAQFEKSHLARRTQRGIRGKLAQGKLPWAPRPYGYMFDRNSDMLVVVPEQADWVRRMYEWVVREGMGPLLIARRLNELGVKPPRANWWYKQRLSCILRNPVYKGELVVNKTDQRGMRKNRHLPPGKKVRKRLRPRSEWVSIRVPAVVDPVTWEKAQEILAGNRRRHPGGPLTPYLLTGVCVCGICGRPCHGFSNGQSRRYYICAGRHPDMRYPDSRRRSHERCGLPHLRSGPIDETVCATVRQWLDSPEEYRRGREAARQSAHGNPAADLERLRRAVADLESEWDRRLKAYQQGLVRDVARAQAEIAQVKDRLLILRRQEEVLVAHQASTDREMPGGGGSLRTQIDGFDAEDWRQAIHLLVSRVTLYPDRLPEIQPR